MAKQSRIAHLNDDMLRSMTTKQIADKFYDGNNGAAWNALYGPTGRLAGEKPAKADGAAKAPRSNGKRRGCFPKQSSLVFCLNKYLNNVSDPDSTDWIESPTWEQFKKCRDINGDAWQDFIVGKAKGDELIASFKQWIASNDAADKAESAAESAKQAALDAAIALIEAAGGTVTW